MFLHEFTKLFFAEIKLLLHSSHTSKLYSGVVQFSHMS